MAEIKAQAFSLCPFRSPVVPPRPIAGVGPGGNEPKDVFGACLYAGCGIFVPTKVSEDGKQVLDGVCGLRATPVALSSIGELLGGLQKKLDRFLGPSRVPTDQDAA